MVMVKLAHSSAAVFFVFFEECMFRKFESLLEEKFLVLIWAFGFGFSFFLDVFKDDFLMSIELLKLNISELTIVKIFAQNDVEIIVSAVLFGNGFHLIREIFNAHGCLVVFEHGKVLVTLHSKQMSIL
jgi:hypothetical protein